MAMQPYNCCLLNIILSRMCFDWFLLLESSILLVCLLPMRLEWIVVNKSLIYLQVPQITFC